MSYDVLNNKESGLDYLHINNNSKTAICIFHGYGASMLDLYGLSDMMRTQESLDWYFPNGGLDLSMGQGLMSRGWFPIDVQALESAMANGTHRDFSKLYTSDFKEALEKTQKFLETLIFGKYERVLLGGFSQGAMISSHLGLNNSNKISGLICFSGALVGQDEIVKKLEVSTKFPFFQSHGKSDPILGYSQAMSFYELMKLGGHEAEFIGFDGVHEIPIEVIKKSIKFINRVLSR